MRFLFAILFLTIMFSCEVNRTYQWFEGTTFDLVERETEEKSEKDRAENELESKKLVINSQIVNNIEINNTNINTRNYSLKKLICQYFYEIQSPPPEMS